MLYPSHRTIADNINDKTTAFNNRLADLDSIMGDVINIDVDYTDSYTLTNEEFYKNCVFRIYDTAGADADITITVPSTPRPMFCFRNETSQNVYVQVSGQTPVIYIEAGNAGYYFYDKNGEATTAHGVDSTATWDVQNATYDSKFFDVGSQDTGPYKAFMSDSDTKVYVTGNANDSVFQYNLGTASDISTASYASKSLGMNGDGMSIPRGLYIKPDGTKLYAAGNAGILQYTMATPWDLATASYDSKSLSGNCYDVFFKPDGTKLYRHNFLGDTIEQFSMSSAWDVSTATTDSVTLDHSSEDTGGISIYMKSDGTKLYMLGGTNDFVFQYGLSSAWDLTGASYDSISYEATEAAGMQGLSFNSSGSKMYIVDVNGRDIYQYDTVT